MLMPLHQIYFLGVNLWIHASVCLFNLHTGSLTRKIQYVVSQCPPAASQKVSLYPQFKKVCEENEESRFYICPISYKFKSAVGVITLTLDVLMMP